MTVRGNGVLRLRPGADDAAWDEFVRKHPDGTGFHMAGFLRTAGPLLGLRADLAVAEADGEVVGLVPMLRRSVGPAVLVNHGLPFPYLGPLVGAEFSADDVLAAVRRYLHPRTLAHFRLQSVSVPTGTASRGWKRRDTWTTSVVRVGGKDDDQLLAALSRQQRGKLRRATEHGLVAGPGTRQDVEQLTAWAGETLARQGLPERWPPGAHLRLYDALAAAGVAATTAVHREGELLAVSLDVVMGEHMICWELGLSEPGRAAGASVVLHAANMRRARDLGAAEFDLLGAPTPGIAQYKRSMGAESEHRGYAHWEPAWLPSRRLLRRISARLPAPRGTAARS